MIRKADHSMYNIAFRLNDQLTGWMLNNKKPLIVNDLTGDKRFIRTANDDLSVCNLMCVPLLFKGKMTGIISVFNKKESEQFTNEDERLLSIIAAQSAQIIENARLLKEEQDLISILEEMKMVTQIQTGLLPKKIPSYVNYQLSGISIPAKSVGGDYFDPMAYDKNLEEAKKLLADAGYPDGKGLPTIEYLYNEGTGHQQIGEALQDMWKKIGVNVTLVSQEWNTFLNTRKNGEYFIARNGWLSDYNDPISMLDMWVTGGGNNDAQWSNADYDALIAKVKASSDPAERFKLMHQAEDIIFAESMLAPIYYYVDLYLLNSKIQGFWASPLGYKYFMYATATK
jgi:ABC-type transport system substrate-binding protein